MARFNEKIYPQSKVNHPVESTAMKHNKKPDPV